LVTIPMPAASTAASTSALRPGRRCARRQPERSALPAPSRRVGRRSRSAPPTVTPSRSSASVPLCPAGARGGEGDVVGSVGEAAEPYVYLGVRRPTSGRLRRSARAPAPWRRLRRRTSPPRSSPIPSPRRPRLRLEAPQHTSAGTGGRRGAERRAGSETRRHGRHVAAAVGGPHAAAEGVRVARHARAARCRGLAEPVLLPEDARCARARPGRYRGNRGLPAHAPSGRRQGWRRCSGSRRSGVG
jgi:hypothetical protein